MKLKIEITEKEIYEIKKTSNFNMELDSKAIFEMAAMCILTLNDSHIEVVENKMKNSYILSIGKSK